MPTNQDHANRLREMLAILKSSNGDRSSVTFGDAYERAVEAATRVLEAPDEIRMDYDHEDLGGGENV